MTLRMTKEALEGFLAEVRVAVVGVPEGDRGKLLHIGK